MNRVRAASATALAAALLASPVTADAGNAADDLAALAALRTQDRRVLTIGWRLTEAMADLCRAEPGLGWTLHDLSQYRPGLRNAVRAVFGLDDRDLGVLALASEGPAARAGVREGDVLVAFGRARFDGRRSLPATATHAPLARDLGLIEGETGEAPVSVRVRRAGQVVDLVVAPRRHCPWPVQVETSPRLFAASDGVRISVSSALAGFAARDDDLAFIVAHEMAHNLHRPEATGQRPGSRAREAEADRIGLILAARAGYETSGAGAFMTALARRAGPRLPWFGGHPPAAERTAALDRLHLWIAAERRAGRPLTP